MIGRWGIGLLLLTVSGLLIAGDQTLPPGIVFEPSANDLSLVYLRHLFGNIANLQGTPNLFISAIIRLFNLGLITFVAGMAGYSVIYSSLVSANDGSGLGQKGVRP